VPAGGTALPGVLGTIVTSPGVAPAALADLANSIEVELAHGSMVLGDADDAALDSGANLAMVGGELLQFGRAQPLGANRWRLTRLWRGRRGTEAAIGTQAAGDRFVLVTAETLAAIDLPWSALGGSARILAQGAGDSEAAEAEAAIPGISVTPPSPAHLGLDGDMVRWVRRSRTGWRWIDGADAPLGEESERYRVTIAPEGGTARTEEVTAPEITLAPGDRDSGCLVTVRQAGSHGLSPPASLFLPA
jgi:hypothetical protein